MTPAASSPLDDRSFHQRCAVAPDLLCDVGARLEVACLVVEETSDTIHEPFVSIGLTDGENATVAILHGLDRPGGRLWLSATLALIWRPAVLRTVARVAFGDLMAGEVVTRAWEADEARIALFCRLGFKPWLLHEGSVYLRLTFADARPFYRRAAARHAH